MWHPANTKLRKCHGALRGPSLFKEVHPSLQRRCGLVLSFPVTAVASKVQFSAER